MTTVSGTTANKHVAKDNPQIGDVRFLYGTLMVRDKDQLEREGYKFIGRFMRVMSLHRFTDHSTELLGTVPYPPPGLTP